ncbi:flagellar protein FliT [Halobacillus karajensis]|uniref:Flagellar protein FliT n=1 Tax=Halobacillus karajensis TaxID=195088 RepID=A0A059NWH3_9BACI|nr:flagellar protein FliT [Halobacillus karajensis]CDQ19216.1 hypothetical protein BN982_01501 [Halobacillus karajensis]CDQ22710.1 hypothetical protein BN983_00925 [Halobacillus karajensis]CDQ26192.1 hypothetical protein BN981_00405 [Halobacillus karajensis]
MGAWQEFLRITAALDEVVHQPVSDHNRASVIENIDKLLETRANLLPKLKTPSKEEETLVKEVKQRDLKINQKLELLFDRLKRDMRNNKKQKSSKQRYVNPYQSVSSYDGIYVDHKK